MITFLLLLVLECLVIGAVVVVPAEIKGRRAERRHRRDSVAYFDHAVEQINAGRSYPTFEEWRRSGHDGAT